MRLRLQKQAICQNYLHRKESPYAPQIFKQSLGLCYCVLGFCFCCKENWNEGNNSSSPKVTTQLMDFLNWSLLSLLPTHPCWQRGCICPFWLRWGLPLPGSAPPPLPGLTLNTGCGLFIFHSLSRARMVPTQPAAQEGSSLGSWRHRRKGNQ